MNIKIHQLFTGFLLALSMSVLHAETCQVVDDPSGALKVKCRGKIYNAIDPDLIKRLLTENSENKKLIKNLNKQLKESNALVESQQALNNRYRTLSDDYLNLNTKFEKSLNKSIDIGGRLETESKGLLKLTERYNELVKQYDELVEKYRKIALSGGSAISFDLGVGMTSNNGDTEPVGLIGMSIASYHIWGIMQTDNSGVLFGKSFDF